MSKLTRWVLVLCPLFMFPFAVFPCDVYDSNGLYLGTLLDQDHTYVTIRMKHTQWKARIEKSTGNLAGPVTPPEVLLVFDLGPISRLSEQVATPFGFQEKRFIMEPNLLYACSTALNLADSSFFLSEHTSYQPVNSVIHVDNCQSYEHSMPYPFLPEPNDTSFHLEDNAPLNLLPYQFPVSVPLFINCLNKFKLIPSILGILLPK